MFGRNKNSRIKYTTEIDGIVKEIPVDSREEANNWIRQMSQHRQLTMKEYWYGLEGTISAIIDGDTYKDGRKIECS